MRTWRHPERRAQRVEPETAQHEERGKRIHLLPRPAGPTEGNPNGDRSSTISQPLIVVRILGGPRDGERFATRLAGLVEGTLFRYFEYQYAFVRDARTGRWGAVPS